MLQEIDEEKKRERNRCPLHGKETKRKKRIKKAGKEAGSSVTQY